MKSILCFLALAMFVFVADFDTTTFGQRRPEWIERDIREEQKRAEQESRMSPEERQKLQRDQQERTAQIPRELEQRREQQRQQRLGRQQSFQNRGNNAAENNPHWGGILTPQGNPVMRYTYEGAYDGRPQRQAAGGMILGRRERTIYLPNGDRIPLPWDALWSGNARVSVEQASDSRQPLYDETIRTRGGEPLNSRIIVVVREYGPEVALEAGLLLFGPEAPVAHRAMTGTLMLMRATPVPDGEAVQWNNVRSAFGGRTVVRIIREP